MLRRWVVMVAVVLVAALVKTDARGQSTAPGGMPPPAGMALAQSAAMRFPQAVRVGDLPGRPVLQPVESQRVLGRVRSIVRDGAGTVSAVIELREWLGWRRRTVAVPIDAMVLVGEVMEVVAYTPEALWQRPEFEGAGTVAVGAEETIKVGLAKPSH